MAGKLAEYEDVNSAIAIYKTVNVAIKHLETVKKMALTQAEAIMSQNGVKYHQGMAGSAGWTKPGKPKLNELAWKEAVVQRPDLQILVNQFDSLKKQIEFAQEEYSEPGQPRFYIR
jgi:superfamily I DNA and RNA helicase